MMSVALKVLTAAALASLAVAQIRAPNDTYDPYFQAGDCSRNSDGAGPMPDPDTPEAFQALQVLHDAATNAITPLGYSLQYSDEDATVWNNETFLDYSELTNYDVKQCK